MKGSWLLIGFSVVVVLLRGGSLALGATSQEVPPATAVEEVITLKIEGWTCASCEKDIRRALEAVPGVKRADVSYARGGAVVEVEPGRVSGDQVVHAVASAGTILSSYEATVIPNGTLTATEDGPRAFLHWFEQMFR